MNKNECDLYPLNHWDSKKQEVSPAISAAIIAAVENEYQSADIALDLGVTVKPLSGAGNHSVFGLYYGDQRYCLKRPTPASRHKDDPETVLRREVGGMCMLNEQAPDLCPRPIAWDTEPAWLLMEMLPGHHLGNVALSKTQLLELAVA